MKEEPLNIISWSGGKDSTATIVLAHEHKIRIDLIIICLVWFDKQKKIYGEYPEVVDWIINYAIPLFESWGYKVKVIESERDYKYWFYHIIEKSKDESRIGKHAGWVLGGMCYMNREKTRPIKKYLDTLGREYIQYVGIASDEPERLGRLHAKKQISLLENFNISESETYEILRPYNLLSPTYQFARRGGCWFCPNQPISEFAYLKQHHPDLWSELAAFDAVENKVSEGFKYGKTFAQVSAEVDDYIANPPPIQLSLFDIL